MIKGVLRGVCLVLVISWLAGAASAASTPLTQLFYERRWKEFDQALASNPKWTPREACLAANAAWLRLDREGTVRILSKHRKDLPVSVLPYADLLRALGLERTGRAEEGRKVAKALWRSDLPKELRYYVAYLNARLAAPAERGPWAREMLKYAGSDSGRKAQALSQVLSTPLGREEDALELLDLQPLDPRGLNFLERGTKEKSIAALEALAVASALGGKPAEAVKLLEAVSGTENGSAPLTARGRFWLALSLYRAGRKEEAIPLWGKVAEDGASYSVSSVRRLASAYASGTAIARIALERAAKGSGSGAEAALFSLARIDPENSASAWQEKLFQKYPTGSAASRLRWEIGWSHWKAGDLQKASSEWEKALVGASEGLDRARLLFWLSRCARKAGSENLAHILEARLASQEPLSVYAWRVFPKGPPGLSIPGRRNWSKGSDMLESWGFTVYARLRLEAEEKGESLARAAWLAGWNGDYAESLRLAARASLLLPRAETLSPEFLSLTHPKAYSAEVGRAAAEQGVEPSLVWAVMRQESAFDEGAVSSAGAMGLMQLMPSTAADEAGRLGLAGEGFLTPSINILLGTAHLARHLNSFGQLEKALAAYNAGSGAVRRWPEEGSESLEEWVEEIPYPETNDYVRKVMGNLYVYNALEGRMGAYPLAGKEAPQ